MFVTDATGNAVNGATITASVRPRLYRKGTLIFTLGLWQLPASGQYFECTNEDVNQNGILDKP